MKQRLLVKKKPFFLSFFLILDLMTKTQALVLNAYSNDINACLFTAWSTGSTPPLSKVPDTCSDTSKQQPLCYSNSGSGQAQFISCYNNETLIPDFTAHKVGKNRGGGRPDDAWHNDTGSFAPFPASSVTDPDDYDKTQQTTLYSNYNSGSQFLAKGHYVPNGDLPVTSANKQERIITFVNTNAAPQWQPFNCGNWAGMEQAILSYVDSSTGQAAYVFTGTSGQATGSSGTAIKLDSKVVTPKYFWKVVCVPGVGSYVFWAENNVGVITTSPKQAGCNGIQQTPSKGIIQCKSFSDASSDSTAKNFMLPPLHTTNCKTSTLGTFLSQLNTLLK